MSEKIYPEHPILIVDDEKNFLRILELILKSNGITNYIMQTDGRDILSILKTRKISLILLDLTIPYVSGWELLPQIIKDYPDIPVVVISAEVKIEKAIECMKLGAYDYISKPIDKNRLLSIIRHVLELYEVQCENQLLKKSMMSNNGHSNKAFSKIITGNAKMHSIFKYAQCIANSTLPKLITGETGTGKELLAEAIHTLSGRKGKLIALNVACEDANFIADTLFGHLSGSFTGSQSSRKGLIEQAEQGTLFLDEIGDMDITLQTKLLRILQEKRFYALGSDVEKVADVNFIFATNKNILKKSKLGKFRKDLYYRLQSHHIHLPPLRERKDDIPLLVDHFLKKAAHDLKKKKPSVPKELYVLLANYDFPGNIRELQGLIYDAVTRHTRGILSLDVFYNKIDLKTKPEPQSFMPKTNAENKIVFEYNTFLTLKELEGIWINEALKKTNGNQTMAAKLLGISRKTLNLKINKS